MSFSNGPTVVTNGLVLSLDAGDRNSYVSGSTTWFDLAGTNNGTLTNGPTFNTGSFGSIVFDGVDDYVNIGTTNFSITRDFTVSFWMDITKNGTLQIFNKGYNSPWGIYIDKQQTNVLSCQLSFSPSGFGQVDTITQSYSGIKNWVVVRDNNVMSWYVNGTQNNTGTINTNNIDQSNSKSWRIGGNVDTPGLPNFQGNIYNQLIYNRALSSTEVLQNYNAQKSRFGL